MISPSILHRADQVIEWFGDVLGGSKADLRRHRVARLLFPQQRTSSRRAGMSAL